MVYLSLILGVFCYGSLAIMYWRRPLKVKEGDVIQGKWVVEKVETFSVVLSDGDNHLYIPRNQLRANKRLG